MQDQMMNRAFIIPNPAKYSLIIVSECAVARPELWVALRDSSIDTRRLMGKNMEKPQQPLPISLLKDHWCWGLALSPSRDRIGHPDDPHRREAHRAQVRTFPRIVYFTWPRRTTTEAFGISYFVCASAAISDLTGGPSGLA